VAGRRGSAPAGQVNSPPALLLMSKRTQKALASVAVLGVAMLLLGGCDGAPACRAEYSPGSGAGGGDIVGGQTGTPLAAQPLGGAGGPAISDATSPNSTYGPYPCY
jgi:hypothetical protein